MIEDNQIMEEVDAAAECCPICCTEYQDSGEYARIVCSGRCKTFSMCRLCVHRQSTYLEQPFVVDDDTGDFTTLDPTKCPQCQESGAFRDGDLPPLSDAIMATEEEETRNRRDGVAAAALARALSRLNDLPLVRFRDEAGESNDRMEEEEEDNGIRRINGSDIFLRDEHNLSFGPAASAGLPHLFSRSGVLYFEVNLDPSLASLHQDAQVGLSLADGMDDCNVEDDGIYGVGRNNKSWGLDLIQRGIKISNGDRFGTKVKPSWSADDVIGIAVNIEKGMIAVSTNNSWEITDGNGVKFEDNKIQSGVYPVFSACETLLALRFRTDDLRYGPPPESIWGLWPKFEDVHWMNLSVDARSAAIRLGYTQPSWSDDEENPIEQKKWNELSLEEQSTANVLGYNEKIWTHIMTTENDDDDSDDDSSDSIDEEDSESDNVDTFNDLRWDALPSDARHAAEILNFTPASWDEDAANPLMDIPWEELTDEQKRAATLLGYVENMWGQWNDGGASFDLPFDNFSWIELPRNAKEAAVKLGYTEHLWNDDKPGPLDDTKFNDLTEEQQFACAALGYSQTSWNFAVNKRLFNTMNMADAFDAMQAISVIMSNYGQGNTDSSGSNSHGQRHR